MSDVKKTVLAGYGSLTCQTLGWGVPMLSLTWSLWTPADSVADKLSKYLNIKLVIVPGIMLFIQTTSISTPFYVQVHVRNMFDWIFCLIITSNKHPNHSLISPHNHCIHFVNSCKINSDVNNTDCYLWWSYITFLLQ